MTDQAEAASPPTAVGAPELPVGVVYLDAADRVISANEAFEAWAGSGATTGRYLSELLFTGDDFLEGAGTLSQLMISVSDADRAAYVVRRAISGGSVLTVMDASDRVAAGNRLRRSLASSIARATGWSW